MYNYFKLQIENYMSHFIHFATIIKYNISVKVIKDSSITFILEIEIYIGNIFIFGNINCLNGAIEVTFTNISLTISQHIHFITPIFRVSHITHTTQHFHIMF